MKKVRLMMIAAAITTVFAFATSDKIGVWPSNDSADKIGTWSSETEKL